MWPTAGDFWKTRQELDDAVVALENLRRRLETPGQRVMMSDVQDLRGFIVSADLWSRVMSQLLDEIQGEARRWASWQTPATSVPLHRLAGAELERAKEQMGLPPATVPVTA